MDKKAKLIDANYKRTLPKLAKEAELNERLLTDEEIERRLLISPEILSAGLFMDTPLIYALLEAQLAKDLKHEQARVERIKREAEEKDNE